MGRTKLTSKRDYGYIDLYIGHVIIFCEGETEKFYFDYFADIIKGSKYTEIEVFTKDAGGNARRTLDYANDFMAQAENNLRYRDYQKFLAFDCDADTDIQNIINEALNSEHEYSLIISNLLFEIWLLMHFENVEMPMRKRKILSSLSDYLYGKKYEKADKGLIREIIQKGDLELAINNAKKLRNLYEANKLTISADIKNMNPYTSVYELVEQFMIVLSKATMN